MNELHYFINETLGGNKLPVTKEDVKRVICKRFGVTMQQIEGKSRKQNLVYARQFYMYFMYKKNLIRTKTEIAESINKNHATAIYSINNISSFIQFLKFGQNGLNDTLA